MIGRALDGAVVLMTASLFLIAAIGGIDIALGPLHLRVHDWVRPAGAIAVLLAVSAWLRSRRARDAFVARSQVASYVATRTMLALVVAAAGVYVHFQVRVAGGLDSYGYVSTAALIASGRLSEPQPLAAVLPFDNAVDAATPLGRVPRADGQSSVPRFPLGFPLMMALFTVFGPSGPFYVSLAMACAALVLAYLIGRESADTLTGLLAAVLVAVDPLFVVYSSLPMSDVPAACWMLAAVWLALGAARWPRPLVQDVAAGLCAGMAMLTRPALLPAVIVLVAVSNTRNDSRHRFAFGAVAGAFVALQLALNFHLYGAITASGYGTASHMFELSLARFSSNVSNFTKWLAYSHTPLFWLVWPVALLVLRRSRWAWEVSAVAAAAAAPYLFYIVFDDWESPRFLLVSIVLVLILSARAVWHLTHGWRPVRAIVALIIALGCAIGSHRFLEREGVDRTRTAESKYALVGEWFKQNTSDRAVVLASLHSGTIRLYGNRQTIRWDHIPGPALAATVDRLTEAGYEPYLALDLPSEPPVFDDRFQGQPVNAQQVARVRVVNIYKLMSAGKHTGP